MFNEQEYNEKLREIAQDVIQAWNDDEIINRDGIIERIDEELDSVRWLNNPADSLLVLYHAENRESALLNGGSDELLRNGSINFGGMAYWAMRDDLYEAFRKLEFDLNTPPGKDPEDWRNLDDETKEDLLAWFNSSAPEREDKQNLADLAQAGRFEAWDCVECGARCYKGDPEDWSDFQGADQVDYASYPGDGEKYRPEYLEKMCDHCRCHK